MYFLFSSTHRGVLEVHMYLLAGVEAGQDVILGFQ